MGRELRRKEEKMNKKNNNFKKNEELDFDIKGSTILKVIFFTVLILLVLYYIVAVFITKEINVTWSSDTDNTEINYDSSGVSNKILAKNIFNQAEDSYYVYLYDFSNEDSGIASILATKDLTIYRVDTNSGLNKNYVTDGNGNRNAKSLADLKVKAPTLIKIDNDRITAYSEGKNEILNLLG